MLSLFCFNLDLLQLSNINFAAKSVWWKLEVIEFKEQKLLVKGILFFTVVVSTGLAKKQHP